MSATATASRGRGRGRRRRCRRRLARASRGGRRALRDALSDYSLDLPALSPRARARRRPRRAQQRSRSGSRPCRSGCRCTGTTCRRRGCPPFSSEGGVGAITHTHSSRAHRHVQHMGGSTPPHTQRRAARPCFHPLRRTGEWNRMTERCRRRRASATHDADAVPVRVGHHAVVGPLGLQRHHVFD